MQDWPLTVDKIFDHAKSWHGAQEIVSRSVEGPIVRTTYAQAHERAKRLSSALLDLGVLPGERVGTLAWNTGRHFEAWYAIMGIGAVCHTLNPRLFADQLCYIINHAADRVIFTDLTFLPTLLEHRDKMHHLGHVVVLTDAEHMPDHGRPDVHCYETLVEQGSADCPWGGFDETSAAALCYTSGTTGDPKGVLYSHRSTFLHTLATMGMDVMAISATDTVLPIVPMFHANAWGLTFTAPAVGAKMVMPGAKLDGASVYELLESEGVTFSGAVPTVWQTLLQHLRDSGSRLSTLKRVVIGGSAVPEALVRAFQDDYGVKVTHAWGMTETSPLGTMSQPTSAIAAMSAEDQLRYRLKQGRPPCTLEMRLEDDQGRELPHDGRSFGRLKVKGPYVVGEYFRGAGGRILDEDGFFDTGDVATLDQYGFMQITDRAKDVIKSGGEWISTIEIENLAASNPKALIAAVIGVPHPRWDERPLLLVKLKPGETATRAEFLRFLDGKIAKWWTPDDVVFVDDLPLGPTGKIDKKVLRERFKGHVLPPADETPGAVVEDTAGRFAPSGPARSTDRRQEPAAPGWLSRWGPSLLAAAIVAGMAVVYLSSPSEPPPALAPAAAPPSDDLVINWVEPPAQARR
jgi:fatty-acyl-CoA synthase